VQAFFAWRIHIISQRWYVTGVSWTGSTARVAITLAICILDFRAETISDFEARWGWTIPLSFSVAMSIDLLNSAALCYYLWKSPKMAPGMHHMIDKIMAWAIETGLATSFCVTLMLIFNLVKPNWGVWECIYVVYAKLYSNMFLLSLNSRSSWRQAASNNALSSGFSSAPPGTLQFAGQPSIQVERVTATEIAFEMLSTDTSDSGKDKARAGNRELSHYYP